MAGIYGAGSSSTTDEGVPSLTYSPADASMPLLFSLARPLRALQSDLLQTFAGQTLTRDEIYQKHSVDTPYIKKNYTETLKVLEKEGAISVESTKGKRRAGTFPDHVKVTFPKG